ncbi:MAG: hypothetical protein H6R41_915 [Deltaproteobacteria bacterium]|nr:hypothetical protein [Deltaproteobacteria bacterium]
MQIPKRMAIHGLNLSMAVFTGLSAYGLLLYYEGGADIARATSLPTIASYAAGIAVCIAGIFFFGVQLDRRKSEERREEDARKTEEAARKGRRKPVRGA